MNFYLDLIIQADEEVPIYFIRNKAYNKLHKALYDIESNDIGVSFPNANKKLGDIIRLHSTQQSLESLQKSHWLGGLSGYFKISPILPIPNKIQGYKNISRICQNMTNSKLNRLIKRGSISNNHIDSYKLKMLKNSLDAPYLELQSNSTNKKYRVYLEFTGLQKILTKGEFNYFGLSKTATVPWF